MTRPVHRYTAPDYPGRGPDPAPVVRRRYDGGVLERMRRGLARPVSVAWLYGALMVFASSGDERSDREITREVEPSEAPPVRMLSKREIERRVRDLANDLVGSLGRLELQIIAGRSVGRLEYAEPVNHLTEEEARGLLEEMFRKNGFAIARDVPLRGPRIELTADGFDAARQVGYEFVGEGDACPDIAELEIERVRGGRAILVLAAREYPYVWSRTEAVDRLVDDVRRFLVWLAEERR